MEIKETFKTHIIDWRLSNFNKSLFNYFFLKLLQIENSILKLCLCGYNFGHNLLFNRSF